MLTTLLISGLALPTLISAGTGTVGNGFVKYPVKGHKHTRPGSLKRQNEVDLKSKQLGTSYTIELTIGTPDQPVEVQLDTGSTDLWVNPNCANAGSSTSIDFCNSLPRFDSSKSSTFKDLGSSYSLIYGGGNATIEWVTDDVDAGSASLKNQRFGLATNSYREPFGILGVGPKTFSNQPDYTYFIDNLVAQGFTNSRAFSLDLRSIDSPDGSIIFGGLDTAKYVGDLKKLPIIPESSAPNGNRYWVSLDSISLESGGSTKAIASSAIPVLLDSGTTLTRLPSAAYNALGANFPTAELDPQGSGFYLVDCAVATQPGSVDFTFAGKTIKVLFKDVIWNVDPSTNLCVIGAQGIPPSESPQIPILGDSFLRAAYCVFDQDNNNVHLAQAANCGSDLVAIGKGADAVPSIVGKCGGSSSTTSSSSSSTSSGSSTTSGSSSATTTSGTASTTSGSTTSTAPTSSVPSTSSVPTSSSYPTTGYYNTSSYAASSSLPTYTSTYSTTKVYTVSSCPPYVTNCPIGHETTEIYATTTTYCPGGSSKPAVYPTSKPYGTESEVEYPTGGSYPTGKPHEHPTGKPVEYPTGKPVEYPTGKPVEYPTGKPEEYPTGKPVEHPTGKPIEYPTGKPVEYPTMTTNYKPVPTGTGSVYPTGAGKTAVTAGVGRLVANVGAGLAMVAVAALL